MHEQVGQKANGAGVLFFELHQPQNLHAKCQCILFGFPVYIYLQTYLCCLVSIVETRRSNCVGNLNLRLIIFHFHPKFSSKFQILLFYPSSVLFSGYGDGYGVCQWVLQQALSGPVQASLRYWQRGQDPSDFWYRMSYAERCLYWQKRYHTYTYLHIFLFTPI